MRNFLLFITLFTSTMLFGQVTIVSNGSTQSSDGRQITVLQTHVSGTLGQNYIGWAEVSDIFTTTVFTTNITFTMTEYTQHPFSQIDGPNGALAYTPMTIYVYVMPPGVDLYLLTTQYLPPTGSFTIGSWPAGTQFQLIAAGGISAPMNQCFQYCGWQINMSLAP